jgi:hypothetical protein
LLRHPANHLADCLRQRTRFESGFLRQNLAVSVAPDESRRNVEREKTIDRLTDNRTGQHVSSNDDEVDVLDQNLAEHRVERGEVSVDYVRAAVRLNMAVQCRSVVNPNSSSDLALNRRQ